MHTYILQKFNVIFAKYSASNHRLLPFPQNNICFKVKLGNVIVKSTWNLSVHYDPLSPCNPPILSLGQSRTIYLDWNLGSQSWTGPETLPWVWQWTKRNVYCTSDRWSFVSYHTPMATQFVFSTVIVNMVSKTLTYAIRKSPLGRASD